MKLARASLIVFALSGCSSGVLQLGPDSYRVSTEGMTLGGVEADAVNTAGRHCASLGRKLTVQSMNSNPYTLVSYAAATVNFRCV